MAEAEEAEGWGFETRAIHAGQAPDPATGAVVTPITLATTFAQDAVGQHRGYEYARSGNPTRAALEACLDLPWTLAIVGDGPCRDEVRSTFAPLPPDRIEWLGERRPDEVPGILSRGDIYVWPGFGEAYGLAYLEAQAAGLPVVAQATAGVPEVVRDGATGLLTPRGDVDAYVDAVRRLLSDPALCRAMGTQARRFVHEERSLARASATLAQQLGRFAS